MIVKCAACGSEIQIPEGFAPGQHFLCPYCNAKLAYWGRTRITRVNEVKEKSGVGSKVMLGVLTAFAIIGLFVYKNRIEAQRARDRIEAEERRAREETEAVKMKNERDARDAADRKRREEQLEKEDAERKRRQEEMEKRDAERAKQRQEAQDKAESERRVRALFEEAQNGFVGSASVIADDFSDEKSPLSFKSDGRFFAVDAKYVGEQKIFELLVEGGKLSGVRSISRTEGIRELSSDEFMKAVAESIFVVRGDVGPVWICGKIKSRLRVAVPEIGSGALPIAFFLKEGYSVVKSLRVALPEVKFRATLQNVQNGGDISLGVFTAADDIRAEIIRSKVRESLTEQMLKNAGVGLTPPKMKKVKRTVVFYDGEMIAKSGQVTKVPRSFKFFGTSRNKDDKSHVNDIIGRARKKWEALCEEAKRQERRELEVEEENQRAKGEYQRMVDEAMRNARASSDDVDEVLKNCKLLIERSKSKLKASNDEKAK